MNRDKKSICLVCKEMAIVNTPLLYTNMVVNADRLNEDLVPTQSVQLGHHGLHHVRTLSFAKGSDRLQDFTPDEISSICSLLRAIPENALEYFE
jgi:hypothetical protein